jgi:uncharacterized protein (DUF2236 family)
MLTSALLRAGARVRAIHKAIRGVDDVTGLPYRADDPELLLWIHGVEVHSFLTAYRRYGGRLEDADADLYVAEMVRAAELVGLHASDVPATLDDLRTYLRGVKNLCVTPAAREGLRLVLNPPVALPGRILWTVPAAAAVAILPRRVRDLYGLLWFEPADPAVRLAASSACRTLRVLLPPPPVVRDALERARASAAEAA